jgi:hypothetical protein
LKSNNILPSAYFREKRFRILEKFRSGAMATITPVSTITNDDLRLARFSGVEDSLLSVLATANNLVTEELQEFAQSPDFATKMELAFGPDINISPLQAAWAAGDFSGLPQIEVRSRTDINGANGAYAAELDMIFISREFLEQNAGNVESVASLLLQEIGHWVDAHINEEDSPSDEGAIFAALVQGETLSAEQLALLKAEDDRAIVNLDGKEVEIEQDNISGTEGDDNLSGTSGDDLIEGLGGNDQPFQGGLTE